MTNKCCTSLEKDTNKPSENKISLKPLSSNRFLILGILPLKYFSFILSTWQQPTDYFLHVNKIMWRLSKNKLHVLLI